MTFRAQTVRGLLVGAAVLAIATPAWAQTQEEQQAQATNQTAAAEQSDLIIVTATKRASTVQDVPFSINAQTQEDIQRANANTIEDISRNVAGLAVQNLGWSDAWSPPPQQAHDWRGEALRLSRKWPS